MLPEPQLKALAHPARRRILELVWDQERTSTDLAGEVALSRPAASQHLKVLRAADLVTVRPEGNHRYYQANLDNIAELRAFLDNFWGEKLERLRLATEGPE